MKTLNPRIAGCHLLRYQHLYTSLPMAKYILREYFGLLSDQVLPISISHGVDFNHERYAQDVGNAEPIHWCYNEEILRRSRTVKETIAIPHPWLMLYAIKDRPKVEANGRILVIGPPPSVSNDKNVLQSLTSAGIRADAILVKTRGGSQVDRSCRFWEAQGISPVSAGGGDILHYHRLMDLLLKYEYVVSPVFSSVTVMASAIKCKVVMLRDFHNCSYSLRGLDVQAICSAPTVRELIATYLECGETMEAMQRSADLLGDGYLGDAGISSEQLLDQIDSVEHPLHVPAASGNGLFKAFLSKIALYSGRSAFLKYGLVKGVRYKIFGTHQAIICKRLNLIDAATNCLSDANFGVRPLRVDEFYAQPGQGADWESKPEETILY